MINLREVKPKEKDFLKALLKDYLIELSKILNEVIDSNYKYLDSYFKEENRKPFFILNNEKIIGFVLINDFCVIKTNEIAIAEFFIQKQFRNKGFAEKAIKQVFKMFDKKWEVKTNLKNKVGLSFWRKVIGNSSKKIINGDVVFSLYFPNQT